MPLLVLAPIPSVTAKNSAIPHPAKPIVDPLPFPIFFFFFFFFLREGAAVHRLPMRAISDFVVTKRVLPLTRCFSFQQSIVIGKANQFLTFRAFIIEYTFYLRKKVQRGECRCIFQCFSCRCRILAAHSFIYLFTQLPPL